MTKSIRLQTLNSIILLCLAAATVYAGCWLHTFVFLRPEAAEEVAQVRQAEAAGGGVGVFGRGDFDVGHVELGIEPEFVTLAGDVGIKAPEPRHKGHLVVGGDDGEEKAVFGGRGGGGPELAGVRDWEHAR